MTASRNPGNVRMTRSTRVGACPPAAWTSATALPPKFAASPAPTSRISRARSSSSGSGRGHPSRARRAGPSSRARRSASSTPRSRSTARFSPPATCSYSSPCVASVPSFMSLDPKVPPGGRTASWSGQKQKLMASTARRYLVVRSGSAGSQKCRLPSASNSRGPSMLCTVSRVIPPTTFCTASASIVHRVAAAATRAVVSRTSRQEFGAAADIAWSWDGRMPPR
mmetsp:Transcript_668/g.981  ORF Transcript_668/g.981 Transcript_668/m.981 type:complete len:224 (+) Transcript_668:363-1034(+)